jgi:hypothetical protein
MSFESFSPEQDENVSRSTVLDGETSTILSHASSIEIQLTVDETADQQSSNLSVGKKRYCTEELPRAGVMKPKTPGEGKPRDGGKARPPAGGRSKDDKKGGNKVGGKGGNGANNQSKGGKGNVKKSL